MAGERSGRVLTPAVSARDVPWPDDVASSGRLGGAAYKLIFVLAQTMLASSVSLIAEANFFHCQEPEFGALPPHRLMQLHCEAALTVLLDRYAKRSRHGGHHDSEKLKELPARFASGAHSPLSLGGELIQLDTTYPVGLDSLAERIRAAAG